MIRVWRPAKRGQTNDDFTLNVDLAPTILAAADIAPPARMQGRDFAPLYLAAEKPAWRTEFFYEHAIIRNRDFIPASEALVRKDWKYFYWPDYKYEQLFDLRADPGEEHDLAADPAQAERLNEMRGSFAEPSKQPPNERHAVTGQPIRERSDDDRSGGFSYRAGRSHVRIPASGFAGAACKRRSHRRVLGFLFRGEFSCHRRKRRKPLGLKFTKQEPGYLALVVRTGNLLLTSGHVSDIKGKLGAGVTVEQGRAAARECAVKILNSVWNAHGTLNGLKVLKLLGCVNSTLEFDEQHLVINGCSDLLHEIYGKDGDGYHARSAALASPRFPPARPSRSRPFLRSKNNRGSLKGATASRRMLALVFAPFPGQQTIHNLRILHVLATIHPFRIGNSAFPDPSISLYLTPKAHLNPWNRCHAHS